MEALLKYYQVNGNYVWDQFLTHFLISIYGVLFAAIITIPIGFYIARHSTLAGWFIALANIIQTIPSLAMLSILMVFIGLGSNTVIVTVFLYSILPILKNTYTAVKNVDKDLLDVAKGLGMTNNQIRVKVEIPLSLSVIMAGVRNAIVIAIAITAVGTFIGAGGLGDIISRGINVTDGSAIIWAGALPTALMAVICDLVLGKIERNLAKRYS